MHPLVFIVFLPLLAAIVAGLLGPWIGKTAAKVVTTGALFVGAALSWPIFFQYIAGTAQPMVVPVLDWIHSGNLTVDWALRLDAREDARSPASSRLARHPPLTPLP